MMKQRHRLLSLNLALLLLLSLLPAPARAAEEDIELAGTGTIQVGGETFAESETAEGPGWRYQSSTLHLSDGYLGAPIAAEGEVFLRIAVDGDVTVNGDITGGDITVSNFTMANSLVVHGSIQASRNLNLNGFQKGKLEVFGGDAAGLEAGNPLILPPRTEAYDPQSENAVMRAGTSAESAEDVTEYTGQPYFLWRYDAYEYLFLFEDNIVERLLSPNGTVAPEIEPRTGYLFLGWSKNQDGSGTLYRPGDELTTQGSGAYRVYYAQWKALPETGVVYRSNGGTFSDGQDFSVADVLPGPMPLDDQGLQSPYRDVEFQGWSLTPTGRPLETYELSQGEVVTVYAVWKCPNVSASSAGASFRSEVGTLSVGGVLIDGKMLSASNKGTGWRGNAADLDLSADYPGDPLETAYDLNLHISGHVTVRGENGPAISAGGSLTVDFEPGATLTLTGGAGQHAISAGSLAVQMPGALIATGGGVPALDVEQALQLSNPGKDDSGLVNRLSAGPKAEQSVTVEGYTDEVYLCVARPTVTIVFDAQGGSGGSRKTVEYAPPMREQVPETQWADHLLLGWYDDPTGTSGQCYQAGETLAVTGDLTLYAVWLEASEGSNALLYGNGGSRDDGEDGIPAQGLPADPAGFSRKGYDFLGWSLSQSGEVIDQEGFAAAAAKQQPVRLYARWRWSDPLVAPELMTPGPDLTVTMPWAHSDYHYWTTTLNGWNTEPDGSGQWYTYEEIVPLSEPTIFYAHFIDWHDPLVCLRAGWGSFGGQTYKVMAKELPATFELPGKVEKEPVLAWWSAEFLRSDPGFHPVSADAPGDTVTVEENTLFRAVFDGENTKDRAWTVQDLAGGTTTDGRSMVVSFASFTDLYLATGDQVVRDGHTLKGWSTEPNGGGTMYLPGVSMKKEAAPRSVYAVWAETGAKLVNVTLIDGEKREELKASQTIKLPKLYKRGLLFAGWDTKPDGTGTRYEGNQQIKVDSDLTLYAQWKRPDLELTIPEEMLTRGGQILVALYSEENRVLSLQQVIPTGETISTVSVFDVPLDAATWKMFCLDQDCQPLTNAAAGEIPSSASGPG